MVRQMQVGWCMASTARLNTRSEEADTWKSRRLADMIGEQTSLRRTWRGKREHGTPEVQ